MGCEKRGGLINGHFIFVVFVFSFRVAGMDCDTFYCLSAVCLLSGLSVFFINFEFLSSASRKEGRRSALYIPSKHGGVFDFIFDFIFILYFYFCFIY